MRALLEGFGEPLYFVKRKDPDSFQVAKFADRKEPEVVYNVHQRDERTYVTDSPAFRKMGQAEKHIKLVKRWLRDGEPNMVWYRFATDGVIVRSKIKSDERVFVQASKHEAGAYDGSIAGQ